MKALFDVVVVGAGPGGMAAATIAAEVGRRVCIIDDNRAPGGQIWRGFDQVDAEKYPHGHVYRQWMQRLRKTGCEVWPGWQATDCPASHCLRVECNGEIRDVNFRNLIVATGARERFLPFPGWTLPGVTGVGGLQALVKAGLEARGKRVVVAGTGPLLLAIAAGLSDAGADIVAIYEQAPLARLARFGMSLVGHPGKLAEGAAYRMKTRHAVYRTGSWIKRVEGAGRVERAVVSDGQKEWTHACDWLACGFHLVPNLELPRLLGCRIANGYVAVDDRQRSTVPDVACIGELTGIGGIDKAILEGQIAGWAAARRDAEAAALATKMGPYRRFARGLDRAFALREELRTLAKAETYVCRCEDVAYSDLSECRGWREAKLHTRCGMGACQGRICGAATEFLFGWQTDGTRPPVFPAAVSAIAPAVETPDSVCH